MSWIFIAIAVVFEVTVGIAAGKAQGFKNIPWTATTLLAGALGTYFLSLALLSFDVGGRIRYLDLRIWGGNCDRRGSIFGSAAHMEQTPGYLGCHCWRNRT